MGKELLIGHDAKGAPYSISQFERNAHMHIIGASGRGKSKFMELLIRDDLFNREKSCRARAID